MQREFEIFTKSGAPTLAAKRGFCWPGFFFSWIWGFARGLWIPAIALLVGHLIIFLLQITPVVDISPVFAGLCSLLLNLVAGLRGNSWRSAKLEKAGYSFVGVVNARSAASAVAAHALGRTFVSGTKPSSSLFTLPPTFQRLLAVTWLTWKAAFRFRLFLVIAVLLLGSVIALPILVQDDGTARGFTQILLTYTLSVITALLGLSTLWLSCGTLARDIEECQIQMVAVKPIARWQIWVGKWLGIVTLNAALLALSGVSVYALLQWRATHLSAAEQSTLRNQVLIARGSAKQEDHTRQIEEDTDQALQEALKQTPVATPGEKAQLRNQIREQVKAEYQLVPPGFARVWEIDLGMQKNSLRDRPLQLRVKFNAADKSPSGTFLGLWQVGVPDKTPIWRTETPQSLAPDTFHELEIPANLFDENGVLTIEFRNFNNTALLFTLDEGIEVLYREGSFALNFVRGLGIIFCWMALLAAIGLAAASCLSFPVATFFSLALLTMAFSSGTLANVVSEGTVIGANPETGTGGGSVIDAIVVPVFSVALRVINLARHFSPIDSLSSGRSITWGELGRAFSQIVLLLGGIAAAIGISIFNRRELATAQGNQ